MGFTLDILEFGEILAQESVLFHEGKDKAFQRIGCFAWLLRKGRENVLVDTGIKDLTIVNQTRRGPHPWLREESQKIEPQLLARGLRPEDIHQIILTHLHYDHCSNVPLFRNAKIVVSREEWERITDSIQTMDGPVRSAYEEVIEHFQNAAHDRLSWVDRDHQVSSDLKVSWVGGHTRGSLWVDVSCQLGRCVLTGDAVFLLDNVRQSRPIGFTEDVERSRRVLSELKAFPGTILPSHDLTVLHYFQKGASNHV